MYEINYHNFLNISDNLFAVIDDEGHIIEKNIAFSKQFTDNCINFFSFIKATEFDDFQKSLFLLDKTETIQLETTFFNTDLKQETKIIWTAYRDYKTSLLYLSGRHVNDYDYAFEQLLHSEEKSRMQLKSVPVPSYTWRRVENDFVLVDFSDIVFHETEGKVQHLIGISSKKLFSHNTEILEDMEKCFTEKETIIKDIKYFIHETEEYKYFNLRYAYVPTDTVIIQIEDTTDEKLMELEIKEREEKYRTLFFNITYSVLLVSNEGQVIEFNDSTLKMFNYTSEEFSTKNIIDIIKNK